MFSIAAYAVISLKVDPGAKAELKTLFIYAPDEAVELAPGS